MIYEVKFTKSARKAFLKLSPELQDRIQIKIDSLAIEPRPNGVKKLKGADNSYRIQYLSVKGKRGRGKGAIKNL
ncbi:hypothetical protein FDUTEX481_00136 [Tolypothrix sp. PCC 7601]|nr:hypothetical protein FDUTEX481_00136 [Tolypothrix sp. PCC 7601]